MTEQRKDNFVRFVTGPYVAIPLAVLSAVVIDSVMNILQPVNTILIVGAFVLFGILQGWFAMLIFRNLIEKENDPNDIAERVAELRTLNQRLSSQLANFEIQERLLVDESLKNLELNAKSIWVVTNNLEADRKSPLRDWVVKNLKNGVEYVWLVPDSARMKPVVKSIITYWEKSGIVNCRWKFIYVPEAYFIHPLDLNIYDAEADSETRVVVFVLGKNRTIGYELSLGQDIEALAGNVSHWIENGKNKKWNVVTPESRQLL